MQQPNPQNEPQSTPAEFSSEEGRTRRIAPLAGEVTDAMFRCLVCGQVFQTQAELDEHSESHKEVEKRVEEQGSTGIG
ncbi:MAG: C2H2-type zinc finger protein [Rhabdochlamydiaceae bacterium]